MAKPIMILRTDPRCQNGDLVDVLADAPEDWSTDRSTGRKKSPLSSVGQRSPA
jgi:hypothetical protein